MQEGQACAGQAQGAAADAHQQVVYLWLLRQTPTVQSVGQQRSQAQYSQRNTGQQCWWKMQGSRRCR
ncbi:hypothetical protein D3C76_1109680 [compost metagenome]